MECQSGQSLHALSHRLRPGQHLGFCLIALTELASEVVDNPERPRAVNATAQSQYARLAGMSLAALTAAIESYLPIVRVFFVLSAAFPALREQLLQHVEASLRPAD
jgi:hypothetical protein